MAATPHISSVPRGSRRGNRRPRGDPGTKLPWMSRQEELPAVPAAPTQRRLPVSGEEPWQESSRKAGVPEPFCHSQREIPAPAPGNPFQMEDGALRQRENPGLVRLHKQYGHGFILSAPSCVTTEFGTNQHDWKVVNALIGMKKLPNLPAGSTGRHCTWMWETTRSLSPPSVLPL